MSEYSGSSNSFPLNAAALQVCGRLLSERGSQNNPIVIDDSDSLRSPSGRILLNCEDFECSIHGPPVWAQGTFECPIKLETDDETWREVQSWVDVNEFRDIKHQADIWPIEEIDLTYSNLPASASKDTEVFKSISEDVHCLRASSLVLEFDKSEDQANVASSTPKADDETIPTEPEDENQAGPGFSTIKADDIDVISTEPEDVTNTDSSTPEVDNDVISTESEDEDQANACSSTPKADDNAIISTKPKYGDKLDTSPALREAGLVSIETQKAPAKRNLDFYSYDSSAPIRRSARVAKRVKV
ncbi:hypothetical protein BO71DRAFT_425843 [Aspergillus ellipticus CBS 707.79]|uniref:Uncharacterized protein n=1 Tax=Aspergillus ellipticus CBS 707.79 TaxID=1448320 RepID=A0A319DMM9_9EURO|nr:hypothetical protein BO71DRAFT_425843 [Aspergillus ellipticus CBS 707.79]